MRPFRRWRWPWPRSWREVYAVIIGLLLGFLAVAYGLDWVKQVLGRWPRETCQVRKKARKRRRGLFCGSQCPIGEAIWPTILAHENAVLYCE